MPCIWLLEKMNGKPEVDGTRKDLIQGGIACGLLLFAASSLQQMGIQYNSRKGRIYYCIFILCLFRFWDISKESSRLKVWMSVFLALIGCIYVLKKDFQLARATL